MMKTEEFEKIVKKNEYVKITTYNKVILYEKTSTINIISANKPKRYSSTGDYMHVDKNGNYRLHEPFPGGWTFINEIKSVIPITGKEWKVIRLLCII